jgi:GT2 family glycosyltransferase
MNIQCTVIAYGLADDLLKLFAAADAPNIKWRLFLHSDIPAVVQACDTLVERYPNLVYYPYKTNRGLSRSWNEGIEASYADGADVAMIINDDMLPGPCDVQRVAEAAVAHPFCALVKAMGIDLRTGQRTPMEFGLTAITKTGWKIIGAFDENIWPIYWEDIDWSRRLNLSGLPVYVVEDTAAIHAGSKTSVTVPGLLEQTNHWYDANLAYYRRKWGAAHTEGERFIIPFDDGDPWAIEYYALKGAWYIDPQFRHAPYGRHDREDVPRG